MNKENRRSFLGKIGLGVTAFLAPPLSSIGNIIKMNKDTETPAIKEIKPLGFQWETSDPFLFCVHHEDNFPEGNDEMGPAISLKGREIGNDFISKDGFRMYHGKRVPGFPGHPHKGFETITIVRKGLVDHADSIGAAGRYGNGDVQWMTAGKGVQHSEMFPLLNKSKKNPLELFQIWLNLPAVSKKAPPHFSMFWKEKIPFLSFKDKQSKNIRIELIAGSINGNKALNPPPNSWAAKAENEVGVFIIHMDSDATWELPVAKSTTHRTLYYYEGEGLLLNETPIPTYHAVKVKSDAKITLKNGKKPASILVLQGKPINEPVIQYGPFVMNTKQEIQEAFDEFSKTRFGNWPWPSYEMTHPTHAGRFAKHADGTIEKME
jgi:redox-sensitive bicupin YhaK (pirin superfamily)